MKVALALGGGGVRGFAHLGVIRALEQFNISIDMITGTSMGAIVGGLYALTRDINYCQEILLSYTSSDILRNLESIAPEDDTKEKRLLLERSFSFVKTLYLWNIHKIKRWVLDPRPFRQIFSELFKYKTFEDCKIPFTVVVASLKSYKEVLFDHGPLIDPILASSSVPGFFPPVKISGDLLIDGGIVSPIPILAAFQQGADFVIAVDVTSKLAPRKFRNGIEVMFFTEEMTRRCLNEQILEKADFVIKPDVGSTLWMKFSSAQEFIGKGYTKTLSVHSELLGSLRKRRLLDSFKFIGSKKNRYL